MVSNEETHKNLLLKRGFMTGNSKNEQKKLKSLDRVRAIQDEMIKNAKESGRYRTNVPLTFPSIDLK